MLGGFDETMHIACLAQCLEHIHHPMAAVILILTFIIDILFWLTVPGKRSSIDKDGGSEKTSGIGLGKVYTEGFGMVHIRIQILALDTSLLYDTGKSCFLISKLR